MTFEPASQHDVAKPRREFFLHPYAVWESQRADPHDRRIDFGFRRRLQDETSIEEREWCTGREGRDSADLADLALGAVLGELPERAHIVEVGGGNELSLGSHVPILVRAASGRDPR